MSNPTVSEWLQSKIVYVESPYRKQFREIFASCFSQFALKKHYVNLARKNYEKYVRNQAEVNLKKYVYVLRALACTEFLLKENKMPPLDYIEVVGYLPADAGKFMEQVVRQKQASEGLQGPANEEINRFIESYFTKEFERTEDKLDRLQVSDLVIKIIESKSA